MMRFHVSTRPRRRQKPNPNSNTRHHSKVTVERASEDPNFIVRTSLRTLVRESRTPPSRRPTEIELSPNALASQRSADAPLPVGEPLIFTRVCSRVSRGASVCAFPTDAVNQPFGTRAIVCARCARRRSVGLNSFQRFFAKRASAVRCARRRRRAFASQTPVGRPPTGCFFAFQKRRTLCVQSLSVGFLECPI